MTRIAPIEPLPLEPEAARISPAVATARLLHALREDTDTRNKIIWCVMTGEWPERKGREQP